MDQENRCTNNKIFFMLTEECDTAKRLLYQGLFESIEIETNINRIIAIANMLHKKSALPGSTTRSFENDQSQGNIYEDIYICASDIQDRVFRYIKNCASGISVTLIYELRVLLEKLVSLVQQCDTIELWDYERIMQEQHKLLQEIPLNE